MEQVIITALTDVDEYRSSDKIRQFIIDNDTGIETAITDIIREHEEDPEDLYYLSDLDLIREFLNESIYLHQYTHEE